MSATIRYVSERQSLAGKAADRCNESIEETAKGVIVDIRDKKHMPMDKYGNYADIIMDPTSIPGRMNAGRVFWSF